MLYLRNFLLEYGIDPAIFHTNCAEDNIGFDEDAYDMADYPRHRSYDELIRFTPINELIGNAFNWACAMQQPARVSWSRVHVEWADLVKDLSPSEINLNLRNTHLHTHKTKAIHVN